MLLVKLDETKQTTSIFRPIVIADSLKVLTNEKRGGLKVAAFDRSPFKLFSLRFSAKSVQAPSCERPETTQRTCWGRAPTTTCGGLFNHFLQEETGANQ